MRPTGISAAILTSINSRGARKLCSTAAAVMSASVSRTGVSALMDLPLGCCGTRLLASLNTPALHRGSCPGASPPMGVSCNGLSCAPGGTSAAGDDRPPAYPSRSQEASGTEIGGTAGSSPPMPVRTVLGVMPLQLRVLPRAACLRLIVRPRHLHSRQDTPPTSVASAPQTSRRGVAAGEASF